MDSFNFKEMYMGKFEPSEKEQALIDKLQEYYNKTPDCIGNGEALRRWRKFKDWAFLSGYTQEDINRVKRSYRFD